MQCPQGIELGMYMPIVIGRVHRDKTCGQVFEIVPTTMELLQNVSMGVRGAILQETYLFVPQLILTRRKIRNQRLGIVPP